MSRSHALYLKTGEKFKNDPIPGSRTYYLENKDSFKTNYNTREYTKEELADLQKYLPKCFKKHYSDTEPNKLLNNLGWCYDSDVKKYYHKSYLNAKNEYIYFDVGVLYWNSNKYLVPLNKSGHFDLLGLTWSYDSVSTIYSLTRNKKSDYWNTRKGKRMAKYIQYRKMRDTKAKMFSTLDL